MDYLDFEIRIAPGEDGRYPVHVVDAPDAERPQATVDLPFDEATLKSHLQNLQIALLQSKSTRRALVQPQEQLSVKEFGQVLFETVLPDDVRACYQRSRAKANASGKGLRLRLRIEAPDLATLPWEFLYDEAAGDFVCLSNETPIVRYLALDRPVSPLQITPPLRILGMIAAPDDKPQLNVAREKQRMSEAIASLEARGRATLTWLEGQTWQELQRAMRHGPWHIFHFVGHGGFDPALNEGVLAFAKEDRPTGPVTGADTPPPTRTDPLPATKIGQLLADHRDLRLVVLNACQGATASADDIFSSTASVLIRRGIPAVVAMQYEITDRAAIEFGRGFYASLADGLPVDASVAEARKSVNFAMDYTVEWGTPVLHMRAPDGRLFDIDTRFSGIIEKPSPPPEPVVEIAPAEPPNAPPPEPEPTGAQAAAAPLSAATSAPARPVPDAAEAGGSRTMLLVAGLAVATLALLAVAWLFLRPADLPPIGRVALLPDAETVDVGESLRIGVSLLDAEGLGMDEGAEDPDILQWTVTPDGLVTLTPDDVGLGATVEAVAPGTVTVTATVHPDEAASAIDPPADSKLLTVLPLEDEMPDVLSDLLPRYLEAQRLFNDPAVPHAEVAAAYEALAPDERAALEEAGLVTRAEIDSLQSAIGRLAGLYDATRATAQSDTLTLSQQLTAWQAYVARADSVRNSPSTARAAAAVDSLQMLEATSPSVISLSTCRTGGLDCPASARADTFNTGQSVFFSAKLRLPARERIRWQWRGPAGTVIDEGSDTFQAAPSYRTYRRLEDTGTAGRYDLRLFSEAGHLIGRRTFIVQ